MEGIVLDLLDDGEYVQTIRLGPGIYATEVVGGPYNGMVFHAQAEHEAKDQHEAVVLKLANNENPKGIHGKPERRFYDNAGSFHRRGAMRILCAPDRTVATSVADIIRLDGDSKTQYDALYPWNDLGPSKSGVTFSAESQQITIDFAEYTASFAPTELMGKSFALSALWQRPNNTIGGMIWDSASLWQFEQGAPKGEMTMLRAIFRSYSRIWQVEANA